MGPIFSSLCSETTAREKKTPKINIRYDEEKSCVYLITQVVTLRNITKAYPNEVFTRKQSLNT